MFRYLKPAQALLVFFTAIILIGTLLLSLPVSLNGNAGTNLIISFFTATSAVCVTGLTVVDTGTYFSLFGQTVILILIQIGGLGYMTIGTMLALLFGKLTLRNRMVLKEAIDLSSFDGLKVLLKHILKLTLLFEGLGAVVLAIMFSSKYGFLKSLYYGVFHSVSAFCNAGFSLWNDSLAGFKSEFGVLFIFIVLILAGGLGYLVIIDLLTYKTEKKLSVHTKIALLSTALLLVAGFVFVSVFEWNNPGTLKDLSISEKIVSSIFYSVTPRTAGFSTLNISNFSFHTLFLLIPLMFIGASPGGTGGGIKTTTFFVVILTLLCTIRGKKDVNIFNRKMPDDVIMKALTAFILGVIVLFVLTFLLYYVEDISFSKIFFEISSAFGTVGLSTGITSGLSSLGKIIVIMTMFIGRLGPLTLGMATLYNAKDAPYRYPEEKVLIG